MKKYAVQMRIAAIGVEGQQKLAGACVAIIGVGALGSVSSDYLARAGVGKLILVDKDKVEEINLHRQTLFSHLDIGKFKVDAAKEELFRANPEVKVEAVKEFLDEKNAQKLIGSADLVLDCTDKMSSRHAINLFCKKANKMWIHAAVSGSRGNVLVVEDADIFTRNFKSGESFDECNEFATTGPVAGAIACMQSIEAIKILTGNKFCKHLQRFDLWKNEYELIRLK